MKIQGKLDLELKEYEDFPRRDEITEHSVRNIAIGMIVDELPEYWQQSFFKWVYEVLDQGTKEVFSMNSYLTKQPTILVETKSNNKVSS